MRRQSVSRYDDPRWYEEQNTRPQPRQNNQSHGLYPGIPAESNQEDVQQNLAFPPNPRRTNRLQHIMGQVVVAVALMAVAFVAGWFSHQFFTTGTFVQSSQSQQYALLIQQAWNVIDQNYVDRKAVNYKQMSYSAIQSMVDSLKDKGHTRFLTPDQVQSFGQSINGTFTGIGIYLSQDAKTKQLIITAPIAGSPAEKAGIKPNDVLVTINGTSVVGKDVNTASNLIHGPSGTSVTIVIQRPSTQQTLTFHIMRAEIKVPNVILHYIPEDHIAQIQLVEFSDGVSDQLKNAILQAKQMGAKKIILDLRNDPGGLVNEAVNVASQFVKSGNVFLEQDSSGQRTPIAVTGNTTDNTDTMVVLVNKGTASAAEIVSGALKDNKRALILGVQGQTTYGTGTVLQQFSLSDGSALLIGTQEWLTPDGQFIRDSGIKPDMTVKVDPNGTLLTPDLENASHMTEQQILTSGDIQLAAAIQYLKTH
jgi:carboxyl-terminal processing protease